MSKSRINSTVRGQMLRHRLARAEESERALHEIIRLYAEGSKVAAAYLQRLGKCLEVQKL